MPELRQSVRPRWPFRLPGGAPDGVLRSRGGVLERLLHVDGAPAVVRVAQPARDEVLLGARAVDRETAGEAIARMRFALGVDDDLRPFYDRFAWDPLIGPSVRRRPWLRIHRRPEPFEALAWAITEQLIEFHRAVAIQRRIVARLGRRCPDTGLRDLPAPARLAGIAPALLESLDLSAGRALVMRRAAREVATGRADLGSPDHERGWRRLRAIPGIGRWTIEMLALHGQGRYDQLPAGDLNLLKLVGRLHTGGNPHARASEEEVRALFAPYDDWAGLAAAHALRSAAALREAPRGRYTPSPGRNSFVSARAASGGLRSSRLRAIQSP
jgi:3-methyladenine DNA glycosylase/8-oxoguanine DNA glycosylase